MHPVGSVVNIGHATNQKGTFFLGVAHGTLQNKPVNFWVKINKKKVNVHLIGKQYVRGIDLALFFLPGKEMLPCFEVAAEDPVIGKVGEMVGSPWNVRSGELRVSRGQIIDAPHNAYHYGFNVKAESGESGGPIISIPEKETIGIVISYSLENSTGLFKTNVNSVKDIRQFLTTYISGVPKCRVTSGSPVVNPKPPPKEKAPKPKEKEKEKNLISNDVLIRKIKVVELKVSLGRTQIESEFKKLHSEILNLKKEISELKISIVSIKVKAGPEGPEGKQGPEGKAGKVNVKIHDERIHKLTEHKNVKSGSTLEVTISSKDQ